MQARKMSFTIFQNEETPFQARKTTSSKSRKIDIFPNRLTHVFGPKMIIFQPLFFRQYSIGKCSLRYSTTRKRLSRLKKKEVQKSPKIDIFSKGLIHGFDLKMAIFPIFFLFNIGRENVFYDILEPKNAFRNYKNKKFKKSKN